jgi:hypothetical protein
MQMIQQTTKRNVCDEFLSLKRINEYKEIYSTSESCYQQLAIRIEILRTLCGKKKLASDLDLNIYQKFVLVKPLMKTAIVPFDITYIEQLSFQFFTTLETQASKHHPKSNMVVTTNASKKKVPFTGDVISHPTIYELAKYVADPSFKNNLLEENNNRLPKFVDDKTVLLKVDLSTSPQLLRSCFDALISQMNDIKRDSSRIRNNKMSLTKIKKKRYLEFLDFMIFEGMLTLAKAQCNFEVTSKTREQNNSSEEAVDIFMTARYEIHRQLNAFLGAKFTANWACQNCLVTDDSKVDTTTKKDKDKDKEKNPYDTFRKTAEKHIKQWIEDEKLFMYQTLTD